MGGYAHACQALLFQEVDLVNQGIHLGSFEWSRLFTPGSLELEELGYEGEEAGFVVLTVEPCSGATDGRNRCVCEAAMAREEDCGEHRKI
jgi:hypothetical protein